MRKLTLKDKCLLLGYDLFTNAKDVFGTTHRYRTSCFNGAGGGGINYYDNTESLERWINQVNEIRRAEAESGKQTLLDFMIKAETIGG